jgi:hypothetical protein
MDPTVGASFIPKKPLAEARGSSGGGFGLLTLLALLIFIASIVAAGAAFAYARYLNISLASKKDSLAKYQQAYDLPTIQALVRFDSRINQARSVLASHVAPSVIFYFLAQQTLEKVQFTNFDYTLNSDGTVKISLAGVANSFSTVALQSDQFGANKMLHDVVFSGITLQDGGEVGFSVSATVDRALILYSSSLNSANTLPPAQQTGTTTSQ